MHALTSTETAAATAATKKTPLEPIEVMNSTMDLCVIDTCGYGALLRVK